MPEDFNRCQANGGRIRTITGPNKKLGLKENEYIHVCFDKEGMHRGEVKKKQESKKG